MMNSSNTNRFQNMPRQAKARAVEDEFRGRKPAMGYSTKDDPEFSSTDDSGAMPASDPSVAYQGPENGPFECNNCQYFIAENQPCQKVSDPVQGEGCCNLFESSGAESQDSEHNEGSNAESQPSGLIPDLNA